MEKETAMEILRKLHDSSLFAERTALETIIPELAESEDEKIRKALVRFHKSTIDIDGIKGADIIAWLEKQGEQKPILDFKASNWYVSKVDGQIHDMTYNPTDKVEPKFKVGDWIVQENIGVYKIIEVCESWYEVVDNKDKHYSIGFDKEYMCHLWTIQDAKDGDVLVGNYDNCKKPWIGIFKCISKDRPTTQFDSYCFLNSSYHVFTTPLSSNFYNQCKGHTLRYAKPATKEQRDLLFQKMSEAEYKWDAEKKELKKIEQKPAEQNGDNRKLYDTVIEELSKYSGNEVYKAPWALDSTGVQYPLYFAELGVKWQKEQKPAWSDEDENYLQSAENACEYQYGKNTSTILWLKSLKDRIGG